jgi:hypothetical protein
MHVNKSKLIRRQSGLVHMLQNLVIIRFVDSLGVKHDAVAVKGNYPDAFHDCLLLRFLDGFEDLTINAELKFRFDRAVGF